MNETKITETPIPLLALTAKTVFSPPGGVAVTAIVEQPPVDNLHVAPGCEQFDEPAKAIEVELVGPDHKARTHHKNSPSKLPYLAYCAGFTSDETGDKDAAERGTKLHEYMDKIVQDWVKDRSKSLLGYLQDLSLQVKFEEGERDMLVYCIRELDKWVTAPGAEVVQEIRVNVHRPDGSLLTSGHLDILIIFNGGLAGLLLDWKFGWLRVKEADKNEQGFAYALGCFEAYPKLQRLGVRFVQPALGLTPATVIERKDIPTYLNKIALVIERAERVQKLGFTPGTVKMLQPGDQCLYCAHTVAGTCPARLNTLALTARSVAPMDFPPSWSPDNINTTEQAAMARYAIERIEDFLEPLKTRIKELALGAPNQKIGCKLATGQEVVYKISQRKFDRSIGKALDVAKALDQVLTIEEVLGCADLSVGRIEEVAANAIYEATNQAEKSELAALDERHRLAIIKGEITKSGAEKERKAMRAKFAAQRITKDGARQQFQSLLEVQGLLTRPEGTSPVLSRDKSVGAISAPK